MTGVHVGMWPAYRRRRPRDHTLALDDGEGILTAEGERFSPASYAEWVDVVTANRLDVFCSKLASWRWLEDAIADPHARVCAARNSLDASPRIVAVVVRRGRAAGSLHEASAWGVNATPAPGLLRQLADTMAHLGVGTYPSPGSLGQATMHSHTTGRRTSPGPGAVDDLRAGLVGGRADLLDDKPTPVAWEYDRHSAYVSECLNPIPVGTACRKLNATLETIEGEGWATWYVLCTVAISSPLPLGPFPVRDGERLSYPTEPGVYSGVWLWRHEIESCRHAGCTVLSEGEGWAWERTEPYLREWAQWVIGRRLGAPPAIVGHVKRAALAGIGWFGMTAESLRVVAQGEPDDDVIGVVVGEPRGVTSEDGEHHTRLPSAEVIAIPGEGQPVMLHWASYIWSMARVHLYDRMLAELSDGNAILSSNFDSVIVARRSNLPIGGGAGEWGEAELTNVRQPYIRAVVADQKTILPGIPLAGRV